MLSKKNRQISIWCWNRDSYIRRMNLAALRRFIDSIQYDLIWLRSDKEHFIKHFKILYNCPF
jgi:hypothetical protein